MSSNDYSARARQRRMIDSTAAAKFGQRLSPLMRGRLDRARGLPCPYEAGTAEERLWLQGYRGLDAANADGPDSA